MSWWKDSSPRGRAVRRVLLITLALNAAVAIAKLAYGWHAGALAIRADGFHSSMDGFGNIVALVGVSVAARPPDPGHPYGHRKVEVLLALFVGVLLLVTAADVARDAFDRVVGTDPSRARIDALAFVVLVATLAVNIVVSIWEASAGKKWASPLLVTDATHTRSDVIVTVGVLASSALSRAGVTWADAVAGAIVAAFVALAGVRLLVQNAAVLVDAVALPVDLIQRTAAAVPGVVSVGDIRSRGVAGAVAMDLTVRVDPGSSVAAGHAVGHAIVDAIKHAAPEVVDVVVHVEPA